MNSLSTDDRAAKRLECVIKEKATETLAPNTWLFLCVSEDNNEESKNLISAILSYKMKNCLEFGAIEIKMKKERLT